MLPAIVTQHTAKGRLAIVARMGPQLVTTDYPPSLDHRERHCLAAFEFARTFDCFGVYVGAPLPANGVAWVPLAETAQETYALHMRDFAPHMERREWFAWGPGSLAPTFWPVRL